MTEASTEAQELQPFTGHQVVLDTRGELVYIGTLEKVGSWFLTLTDADVHDLQETRTSKEVYIMEAAKHGIKKNRQSVLVRRSEVVSISLLTEVIQY